MKARHRYARLLCGIALIVTAIVLCNGCKKHDEHNGITGKVSVSGGSNDGVTVELYDAPSFSTFNVWNVTGTHAAVGFPYTPQAAWDWRAQHQSLQSTVITGADGSFNFPNLPTGPYMVTARKDSFGWSLPVSASISGSKADVGTITLRHDNFILTDSVLTSDTHWLAGQHYVLERNVTVLAGATLTIDPGAVVRIAEAGGKLNIAGTLQSIGTPDAFIQFTSSEANLNPRLWQYISFLPGSTPPNLQYCSFSYGESAIRALLPGGTVEKCYFSNITAEGVGMTGGPVGSDSVVIRHCVFEQLPTAIRLDQSFSGKVSIDHNAVFNCSIFGVRMESVHGGAVQCNYFLNDGLTDTTAGHTTGAIFLSDVHNVDITNNQISKSWIGIYLESLVDSSVNIRLNNLYQLNTCLYLGLRASGTSASYPTYHMNSMLTIIRFIVIQPCVFNTHTVDADSNYWSGDSPSGVDARNTDCDDAHGHRILHPTILTTAPSDAVLCTN